MAHWIADVPVTDNMLDTNLKMYSLCNVVVNIGFCCTTKIELYSLWLIYYMNAEGSLYYIYILSFFLYLNFLLFFIFLNIIEGKKNHMFCSISVAASFCNSRHD